MSFATLHCARGRVSHEPQLPDDKYPDSGVGGRFGFYLCGRQRKFRDLQSIFFLNLKKKMDCHCPQAAPAKAGSVDE
jgi:hypothetical protein